MNRDNVLAKAVQAHGPCALVSVLSTSGSTPRDTDAWMIVTPQGFHGSIGGGTLEWKVMAQAQRVLQNGGGSVIADYVLGPDLGQCCGGRMQIAIQIVDAQSLSIKPQQTSQTHIYLFGAGHVGRALVLALAPLPFEVLWIDPRANAFPDLVPTNVQTIQAENPVKCLEQAPACSLCFIMTHSHALDLEIVDAALRNKNLVSVGLIGSATKRARFEKRLIEAGVETSRVAELICPIGVGGISSKHPAAIAVSVVAQILQLMSAATAQFKTSGAAA